MVWQSSTPVCMVSLCLSRGLEAQGIGHLGICVHMGKPREWPETMPRGVLREHLGPVGHYNSAVNMGTWENIENLPETVALAMSASCLYSGVGWVKLCCSIAIDWAHRFGSLGLQHRSVLCIHSSDPLDPENVKNNSSSSSNRYASLSHIYFRSVLC